MHHKSIPVNICNIIAKAAEDVCLILVAGASIAAYVPNVLHFVMLVLLLLEKIYAKNAQLSRDITVKTVKVVRLIEVYGVIYADYVQNV